MGRTILITGGCRSGKSRYALEIAEKIQDGRKCFLATCEPGDDEMKQRIKRHQEERGKDWETVETPLKLAENIAASGKKTDVMVVDCLTLWISNLLIKYDDEDKVLESINLLMEALQSTDSSVIMVTNEVGMGIVPENRLARIFRDIVGFANQRAAQCAEQVVWMVSGIPVMIKGEK